jgi:hypothetical protein
LVFISKRKLFQELFENVFEVLEKKNEIFFFSASGRKPSFPALFSFGPAASLVSLGCGPRCGPAQAADVTGRRALLSLVSMTRRARL